MSLVFVQFREVLDHLEAHHGIDTSKALHVAERATKLEFVDIWNIDTRRRAEHPRYTLDTVHAAKLAA